MQNMIAVNLHHVNIQIDRLEATKTSNRFQREYKKKYFQGVYKMTDNENLILQAEELERQDKLKICAQLICNDIYLQKTISASNRSRIFKTFFKYILY